jgi:hypothetical protein
MLHNGQPTATPRTRLKSPSRLVLARYTLARRWPEANLIRQYKQVPGTGCLLCDRDAASFLHNLPQPPYPAVTTGLALGAPVLVPRFR